MKELSSNYDIYPPVRLRGQLWGEPFVGAGYTGVRLGRPRGTFSGTDALGMSVNPDAVAWLGEDDLPTIVFGEGARLANERFLSALATRYKTLVVLLMARNAAERRLERGSHQNPTWIKGRKTASYRMFERAMELGIPALAIDTTSIEPATVADNIRDAIDLPMDYRSV
jgi:hypothetical protein